MSDYRRIPAFSRLLALCLLLLLAFLCAGEVRSADERKPTEYEVKAAYIYNFAKFVEWPSIRARDGEAAISICLVGKDPFGPVLDAIEGKAVGNRKIRIRRNLPLRDLKGCDSLFISNSEEGHLGRLLEEVQGLPVLTIGDTNSFAERGVIVNFYREDNRVRFEINPKAAARAKLKISANLLRIAKIVGEP